MEGKKGASTAEFDPNLAASLGTGSGSSSSFSRRKKKKGKNGKKVVLARMEVVEHNNKKAVLWK